MKVCEEFISLQGEGKYTGTPSYFIRTTGCNLRCSWKNPNGGLTMCDTPYTSFKPEKGYNLDLDKLLNKLHKSKIEHVVVTGGEPTLQKDLRELSYILSSRDYSVTVETNGTKYIPGLKAFMSLSPKLSSSGYLLQGNEKIMHKKNNRFAESCLKYMQHNNYQFKFVGNEQSDLEEISMLHRTLKIPHDKIYIMPQGIKQEQFKERDWLIAYCIKNGFNYSPRLHVDLWGNKRGK